MYIKVNGINLYYEISGQGNPVILVHGNGESSEIFDKTVDKLKNEYSVYSPDSRCHGHSDDAKEISYELMADDFIKFIKELKINKPVFYGFSDGGIIGLLIAIKEPDLLSGLIISGANINPFGLDTKTRLQMKLEYLFKKDKLTKMMLREPNIKTSDLNKIKIQVNVVVGENDLIKPEHTELIAKSIKDSTLEIVPGEDHGSYIVHSDKLYDIIEKYIKCSFL